MSSTEKDLELKLRTMRYLWRLGYFVRRNIDLVEYGYEKSRVYTDIDVLGVKLDKNFNSHFIVCDCKSGIKVKTAERLFWLSGIKSYFNAEEGLFIRNQMMEAKYAELSKRLEIAPISSTQLSDFEKTFVVPKRFYGPFCEEQGTINLIFSELKDHDRFVHDYILKRYWKDKPQQQIVTLMTSCQRLTNIRKLENYKRTFILSYILSSLSLSVLRLSNLIMAVPDDQKETLVKYELLGGEVGFSERRKLLEAFYEFMVKEIEERYKERYPLSKAEFLENLIPEYTKYLIDLIIRICGEPISSVCIPHLMDLLTFEFALNNRKVVLSDAIPVGGNEISLKPLRDYLVFVERSNLGTNDFLQLSKEYLDSLEEN
ncbi:MAG: hypothetical protein ACFFA1_08510 [Promethearchaeota archaeon]